jgi:ATP-dependent helicase/nuclease subunit B
MARVSTIPAGVPFVDALARGLLLEAGPAPMAFADWLVLLPNRRACRSLADAFLEASDRPALILPRIQPIGDLDPDELPLDGLAEEEVPPALGGQRRRLLLTRLLCPLGRSIDEAARLAKDLGDLLDELQTERLDPAALDRLVPDHLAAHWQQSREILQILVSHWPAVLAEEQAIDPAERRHLLLGAIAERWRQHPPAGRIIAAGSTGSIPATRDLLKVIAGLEGGELVLPGLERGLDQASWEALGPQHPQYGLKQLLDALSIERDAVTPWPEAGSAAGSAARCCLLAEVMRPAATIGAWRESAARILPDEAFAGLEIAQHPDVATEAAAIALRLRAALEWPGRTAALVTPDRQLARRVAVELRRFDIEIDDSAGVPLDQTAVGSFLLLTAALMLGGGGPVALLSVLKHPLARAGLEPGLCRRRARELERLCLRGPRLAGGFGQLLDELNDRREAARTDQERERIAGLRDWLESLAAITRPLAALAEREEASLEALLRAHLRSAEALASVDGDAAALWSGEAGEQASALLAELLEASGEADRTAPAAYPGLLAQLMAERPVRRQGAVHPRLALWGQLEARLQQADLVILGGLNEAVWPRAVEPGPWLSAGMREQLGLPPLECRIGQAAHDFVQAAAAKEVVLSRAEKDVLGNPTVPSRWLTRLRSLLLSQGRTETLQGDPAWDAWATALDRPTGAIRPDPQPRPTPPLRARPRELSVSDIGRWLANPYELYAKRILKLSPLEPLEADPGAQDRGILIHGALEKFVRAFPETLPPDALQRLRDFGLQAFAPLRHRPQVQALWWPRFMELARWLVAHERDHRPTLAAILPEVEGAIWLDAPAGRVRIKARADRLEREPGGAIRVIDYKTGGLPQASEVRAGLAPQLPLEGHMVEAGGFEAIGPAALGALEFWQLVGNSQPGRTRAADKQSDPAELAAAAAAGLARLIAHFDQPGTAYAARPRPAAARPGDYDHLARVQEWRS